MWYFVVMIVSLILTYARTPKSQQQNAEVGTIDTPTASEGSPVPVLFGTRLIKGSNIVWYGDIKTVAIKKKGGKK